MKPEKVKSRWRRNSEMESCEKQNMSPKLEKVNEKNLSIQEANSVIKPNDIIKNGDIGCKKFPVFEPLEENLYRFERKRTKGKKEVRRMLCECALVSKDDFNKGILGCQDECLNRLMMIECGSRCINGDACSNKRFQKRLYAKTEPFKTERKGYGLKLLEDISKGSFVIEYCGEVLNTREFKQRVKQYARKSTNHYYFMSLTSDEFLDATQKGNLSRFINHSCEPNCETQKWTVNGELRVGFFAKRDIKAEEELTFDYQFQRYGKEAQKCYCGSENCNGFIGVSNSDIIDISNDTKSNKRKKSAEEKKQDDVEDSELEDEIEKLCMAVNGKPNDVCEKEPNDICEKEPNDVCEKEPNDVCEKEPNDVCEKDSNCIKEDLTEEKPQEIKVVCNTDEKYNFFNRRREYHSSTLSVDEKRSFFAQDMQSRERLQKRKKYNKHKLKFSPHFNNCANYYTKPKNVYNSYDSNNENYHYASHPVSVTFPKNSNFINTNNNPRPPLLPTPSGIQPSSMYINASEAKKPNESVFPPNVFIPPPTQIPFIGLPPAPIPQQSPNVAHFPTNIPPAPNHLINIPPVASPPKIVPAVGNADSLPSGYIKTQNDFIDKMITHTQNPNILYKSSSSHQAEQTGEILFTIYLFQNALLPQPYPLIQENGEIPVKVLPSKLPPNWRTATDEEGNAYYYHMFTRKSQWEPPCFEEENPDELDSSTPTYDEPKIEHKHETKTRRTHKKHSKRKSTTTAPADTSSNKVINGEIAKKIKELFRTKMSSFVVQCLNPYRKDDCRVGKISSNEDFKHLARKLTHFVMAKELKHCKNVEDLDCNDNVKHKARDYIHKYMARYGPLYRKEKSISFIDDKV